MSAYPSVYPNGQAAPYGGYPQQGGYPAPAPVAYPQPAPVAYPAPSTSTTTTTVIQQFVAPPPPVAPLFVVDSQRISTHQPGVLVYSAKFSEARLACLYDTQTCPCCFRCCTDTTHMAKLTHFDVYTNAVVFSQPHNFAHTCDGCCGHNAIGTVRYYDHPTFSRSVTSDGNCYGHIYACFACQGSFGEQITFMNSCCTDCICNRTAMGHFCGACNMCGATGCGINETIFGLKEDEGRRLAAIINEQANKFRRNPHKYELDPLVANGVDTKFI